MKAITIGQAEQAKSSSVWALNTSGERGTSKGIINLTITEGNGVRAVLRVPVTFIPIDLSSFATKSAILTNPDFRRLVTAGIVTLVSDAEAEAATNNDRARAELRRILNIDQQHVVQDEQTSNEVKSLMSEAEGAIGGFAMNIAHTTDGDEDAIVSNLRNNAENLSKEELQYIVNNSQFHKVKGLAAELVVG